jgi:nucleotide-binding universal stress UspA family protein
LDQTALQLKSGGVASAAASHSRLRHAKRILVPVDFSKSSLAALDYAILLAGQMRARLILLHIVEPSLGADFDPLSPSAYSDVPETFLREGRDRLRRLVRERVAFGVQVEVLVRMGRALAEIPDTARAVGADLLVLGAQGQGGFAGALLGSTADRVMRRATCPVLAVGGPLSAAVRAGA